MTERVLTALRGLGIEGTPAAALEREDAFFALLGEMLVYQDAQGTRRVTLRDLTRIHSDQGGLLRVETPAGTALTASLLGFDPAQVQPFFAQVRDATARAKNLPSAPLPTSGGLKTFGSAVRSPIVLGEAVPPAAPAPAPTDPPLPEVPAKATVTVRPKIPAPQTPAPQTPPAQTPAPQTPPAQTPAPQTPPAQTPATQTSPPTLKERSEDRPAAKVVAVSSAAKAAPAATPAPQVPVPPVKTPSGERVPARPADLLTALAERASAVHGLVSRLRLLAVVLGLAAVGLAVVQYLDENPFQGLWTLIAGGVGAVALLIFADVTRLIVTLARAVAGDGRVAEPPRPGAARPDAPRP